MKITDNFSSEEFACKDGTPVPNKYVPNMQELAENLQVLRDDVGVPITINSGYRTPDYNRKVGGELRSKHLQALAADIVIEGMTPKRVAARIELLIAQGKMMQGGIGVYKTFCHYDVRGTKARWNG